MKDRSVGSLGALAPGHSKQEASRTLRAQGRGEESAILTVCMSRDLGAGHFCHLSHSEPGAPLSLGSPVME